MAVFHRLGEKLVSRWPSAAESAFWIACLAALQLIENLIPRFPLFSWLKLGLPWIILLPLSLQYGSIYGLYIYTCRTLLAFLLGFIPFVSLCLSLTGGIVTLGLLTPLVLFLSQRRLIGFLLMGSLMACSFNLSQLFLAEKLFIQHEGFYFQLRPLLIWSLFSGAFIAFCARQALPLVSRISMQIKKEACFTFTSPHAHSELMANPASYFSCIQYSKAYVQKLIGISVVLMPVLAVLLLPLSQKQMPYLYFLNFCFLSFFILKKKMRILLGVWPWIAYMLILHGLFSTGTYIEIKLSADLDISLYPLTYEGLQKFIQNLGTTLFSILWPALVMEIFGKDLLLGPSPVHKTPSALQIALKFFPFLPAFTLGWIKKHALHYMRFKKIRPMMYAFLMQLLIEFKKTTTTINSSHSTRA